MRRGLWVLIQYSLLHQWCQPAEVRIVQVSRVRSGIAVIRLTMWNPLPSTFRQATHCADQGKRPKTSTVTVRSMPVGDGFRIAAKDSARRCIDAALELDRCDSDILEYPSRVAIEDLVVAGGASLDLQQPAPVGFGGPGRAEDGLRGANRSRNRCVRDSPLTTQFARGKSTAGDTL